MANRRLTMRKIKELLRLRYEAGRSIRQISSSAGITGNDSPAPRRTHRCAPASHEPSDAGSQAPVNGRNHNPVSVAELQQPILAINPCRIAQSSD